MRNKVFILIFYLFISFYANAQYVWVTFSGGISGYNNTKPNDEIIIKPRICNSVAIGISGKNKHGLQVMVHHNVFRTHISPFQYGTGANITINNIVPAINYYYTFEPIGIRIIGGFYGFSIQYNTKIKIENNTTNNNFPDRNYDIYKWEKEGNSMGVQLAIQKRLTQFNIPKRDKKIGLYVMLKGEYGIWNNYKRDNAYNFYNTENHPYNLQLGLGCNF